MTIAAIATTAATANAATSVRRVWKLRLRARAPTYCLTERVADTADGVDEPGLALGLELAPEIRHVDLQGVGAGAEIVAPHLLEDPRAGEDDARVADEQLQEPELGAGELQLALAAAHLHRLQGEHQLAHLQDPLAAG